MLSHVLNSVAGRENYEYQNNSLFRCTFNFPKNLKVVEPAILHEHVLNVTGLTNGPEIEVATQQFLQARRNYASNNVDITQRFEIAFSLNYNKVKENYVGKTFLRWRNYIQDNATGRTALKRNYVGKITIEHFDREGTILWKRTLHNTWITNVSGNIEFDVTNSEPAQLTCSFIADYFTEEQI